VLVKCISFFGSIANWWLPSRTMAEEIASYMFNAITATIACARSPLPCVRGNIRDVNVNARHQAATAKDRRSIATSFASAMHLDQQQLDHQLADDDFDVGLPDLSDSDSSDSDSEFGDSDSDSDGWSDMDEYINDAFSDSDEGIRDELADMLYTSAFENASRPKQDVEQRPPNIVPRRIDDYDDSEAYRLFRFNIAELHELFVCLRVPDEITGMWGHSFGGEECFLVYLRRMASFCFFHELVEEFDQKDWNL